MATKKNTVIVIAGPTAVGKTAFAIKVARHFHTQIISADSRQCFKELDIGVAKPSMEELQQVHHYFINSHSIHEEVNAGTFEAYALSCADEIFKQNHVAVMVGGTGLYIKAFCEGMDAMPKVDDSIRKAIMTNYEANGLEWLQQEVQEKDNAFWLTAEQQNPQRLMRALEIYHATGKSINAFRNNQKKERAFDIIKIGLELPREELNNRINNRVDQMMQEGLLAEAESLIPFRQLNALQTVGYREFFDFFDGNCNLQHAINQLKTNTRQYAKRQMTWFKKDGAINWFNANAIEPGMINI